MQILIQNKTLIVNTNNYDGIGVENNNVVAISDDSYGTNNRMAYLGTYDTSEKAKNVVNDIYMAIGDKEKFSMPEK